MAKYADLSAAASDGVIHYWDFAEQSLTVTDKVGSWDGTIFVSDQADRPASGVSGSDVVVSSELGFALDMSATLPPSPSNYDDYYITPADLGTLSGASPISAWSIRCRFLYRGMLSNLATTNVYPNLLWFAQKFWASFENDGRLYVYTDGPNYLGTANAVSENVWHELIATYDGANLRFYLDGAEIGSGAESTSLDLSNGPSYLGGKVNTDDQADAVLDEVSIWNRTLSAGEVSGLWNGGTAQPLVGASGSDVSMDSSVPIVAEFQVRGPSTELEINATLGVEFSATAYQDWAELLPPTELQEVYALTITGAPDGEVDIGVPISSWQATNQAGDRSSFLQAVIPANTTTLAAINARQNGELVISKGYRLSDGAVRTEEILRSNFDALRWDRGPRSFSVTVSGYTSDKQPRQGSRQLKGVRSVSLTGGKFRVRCEIDLFLQPGMTVTGEGFSFTADYINYYVSGVDKFCEVSER